MRKSGRIGMASRVAFLMAAMLIGVSAFAQPARPATPPDIAAEWVLQSNEDPGQIGGQGQPTLGYYLGIPFNDAGRMRADTSAESIWGTPEYQCRPHSSPHQWRGLGGARIMKEEDPLTREIVAYHISFMRSLDWPIYMDGRPHPPPWAPHTWTGFSTGEWVGNTLKVTTTHLKDGYLRRGGPQTSDMYTMTDFITRHGEFLTTVTVIDDPIYMDEPFIQSTTYQIDVNATTNWETCNASAFAENGGTNRHWVPHFLPGQNTALTEWLKNEKWIPEEASRGGVKTIYPEYGATLGASQKVADLKVPASRSAINISKTITDQGPKDGEVHVLPVQGNVYMLVADGTNVTVSIGPDGVLMVNTGAAPMSDKILAKVRDLVNAPQAPNQCFGVRCPGTMGWSSPFINTVITSPAPAKPLRYIINTSSAPEHVGGNQKIASSGAFPRAGGFGAAVANPGRTAQIIAHENVLFRMSAPASAGSKEPAYPAAAQPTDSYFDEFHKLPQYVNGEAVIVYHEPSANTDGDSIVFFRHSEVISAGNIFSTVSYPVIDIEKGGSLQGVIKGLNHILDLAVAEYRSQGGTWIIPGRGRLSDTADVASYRNMLTIIRDRIQDAIDKGRTLDQVKAARLTMDFDGRYGSDTGSWTTAMFIEAAYKSLKEKK
jgi:glyoxylase-like metal-dependent hydrolase (beta-lactamase superfamily II)